MPTLISHLLEAVEDDNNTTISKITLGPHWTVVLVNDGRCGMASYYPSDPHCDEQHGAQRKNPIDVSQFIGQKAKDIYELARDLDKVEGDLKSLVIATINALVPLPSAEHISEGNARELLVQRAKGKVCAMVGHFPFTKPVREVAKTTYVLELHPKEGDYPAEMTPELIPKADVIGITASTIVNGTIDGILKHCRPDAWVMLMGQSSPLTTAASKAGINAVGGALITEPEALLESAGFRNSECQGGLRGLKKVLIEF